MDGNNPGAFFGVLGVAYTGLALFCLLPDYQKLSAKAFFQPASVARIASSLPSDTEDNFILSAWKYVGGIPYENVGSNMEFYGNVIQCADCYVGGEAAIREKGNCVSKSSLLVSILANRIAIPRIKLVVGDFEGERHQGHMWSEVWRNNDWYILESTALPRNPPWMRADDYSNVYVPSVFISPDQIECWKSGEYCRI